MVSGAANTRGALAMCNCKSKKLQRLYRCLLGTASLTSAKKINRIAFLNFCNTICQSDLL
jgi:hypothetical protein